MLCLSARHTNLKYSKISNSDFVPRTQTCDFMNAITSAQTSEAYSILKLASSILCFEKDIVVSWASDHRHRGPAVPKKKQHVSPDMKQHVSPDMKEHVSPTL